MQTGRVFGTLTVIKDEGYDKVLVSCLCGNIRYTDRWSLSKRKHISCGTSHKYKSMCGHPAASRAGLCKSCSIKNTKLKEKFNISILDYNVLLEKQNYVCKICGKPELSRRNGIIKSLAVDHDHSCCLNKKSCGKCIRGLLCSNCNQKLRDTESIDYFSSIIIYLEEYNANRSVR